MKEEIKADRFNKTKADLERIENLISEGNTAIDDYYWWKREDHDFAYQDVEKAEETFDNLKDIFKQMLCTAVFCKRRVERLSNLA